MNQLSLQNDLHSLAECDLIRYLVKDDSLSLLIVGDNDEEEHHHDEEEDDDCCGEMNGHLFRIDFKGVNKLKITGHECDSYLLKSLDINGNDIKIVYQGNNLDSTSSKVTISFSYTTYEVVDRGKIESCGI